MKIAIISDVHIDLNPWDWSCLNVIDNQEDQTDYVNTVIVAGDISNDVRMTSRWLVDLRDRFTNVIWVPGNHDFYNLGFSQTRLYDADFEKKWPYPMTVPQIYDHYIRWSEAHDIHMLHRSSFTLEGVTFVGATGWHDFVSGSPYSTEEQIESWVDFINDAKHVNWGKSFDDKAVIAAATGDAESINNLVKSSTNPVVVVTHHIPYRTLAVSRPGDAIWTKLNGSFVNTLLETIVDPKIKLWIYGHTHFRGMHDINGQTYLCNARGYRRENPSWEPIIIDV